MKTNKDIEKQFDNLKSHYQVPDSYFENFKLDAPIPAKHIFILKRTNKWLIAATLLLLVSLGYQIIKWQQHKDVKTLPAMTNSQISKEMDLFSDLSDDEIINYLSDQDIDLDL
jgi:hypothetical protein